MGTEYDPYAPPAEPIDEPIPSRRSRTSDYTNEERSLALYILFWVITLGIYPIIWLFRRRAFLDSLDSDKKLGMTLPTFIAVGGVLVFVLSFYSAATHGSGEGIRIVQAGVGIAMIVAVFRIANILRSDFNRTGRFLSVSSVMVFFFGTFYLQYKINQAAHVAARRPKKKKKKKPAADAPVVDESPTQETAPE